MERPFSGRKAVYDSRDGFKQIRFVFRDRYRLVVKDAAMAGGAYQFYDGKEQDLRVLAVF